MSISLQNTTENELKITSACSDDIKNITHFILKYGPNMWNYLPEESVRNHVSKISTKETHAVIAKTNNILIGVITFEIGIFYPQYQKEHEKTKEHGYISEAVVHSEYRGKGIGPILLRQAISILKSIQIPMHMPIHTIYAMRHVDNIPSYKMMTKCDMELIDDFDDFEVRTSGSRKTAIHQITL